MARLRAPRPPASAFPETGPAEEARPGGQQQMRVKIKQATHRLAALRVRQQRAQRSPGGVPGAAAGATGGPKPV